MTATFLLIFRAIQHQVVLLYSPIEPACDHIAQSVGANQIVANAIGNTMSLKAVILATAFGVLTTVCLPINASAQSEPQTIRNFARSLAHMNRFANHCSFQTPELAPSLTGPVMEQTLDLLARALTERALSLGVDESKATSGVATYMAGFRRPPEDIEAFRKTCTPAVAVNLSKSLAAVQSQSLRTMLKNYAEGAHYDQPFTAFGRDLETFASPQTQGRLIIAMKTHFDACDDFRVKTISVTGHTVGSNKGLPVFVKPAIIYEEQWSAKCGGTTKAFNVKHARDSEGPVGRYVVAPIQ